jgi:hypothetical protein
MLIRSGLLFVALLFSPLAALAQDNAPTPAESGGGARELFERGQVAYTQGDYDTALELWRQAYGIDPRPLLQWNIAQACERLGQLEDAAAALELYLANADPSDVHQADARARLASLRERIAATGILFRGGPDGATITIDGADSGRLPRPDPIRVSAGSHDIVVTAPGYETFRSTVGVPAGDQVEVSVAMAGASGGGEGPPIAGIVLFGVAGVSTITAAILGGVALGQAGSAPASTGPEADSARGMALGADILFGVGAASAVAAVIVTVLTLPSGSAAETAALEVVPVASATEGGVIVRGSF